MGWLDSPPGRRVYAASISAVRPALQNTLDADPNRRMIHIAIYSVIATYRASES
ncbi:MAG: hypothetical protein ACLQIB_13070 [Isosphaeraceae bacterium]